MQVYKFMPDLLTDMEALSLEKKVRYHRHDYNYALNVLLVLFKGEDLQFNKDFRKRYCLLLSVLHVVLNSCGFNEFWHSSPTSLN